MSCKHRVSRAICQLALIFYFGYAVKFAVEVLVSCIKHRRSFQSVNVEQVFAGLDTVIVRKSVEVYKS